MRHDPLQQYAKLRRQLLDEKNRLQARLNEINQVLGDESAQSESFPPSTQSQEAASRIKARRRRKPRTANTLTLREAVLKTLSSGPVARKDLVEAVEGVGFKFSSGNPLNSIGSILYAKNTPVKKTKDGQFYVEGADRDGSSAGEVKKATTEGRQAAGTMKRKKRKMSAEGRARIAAAQKARWAKQKAGK